MRHYDTKVQDFIERLQGALTLLSTRKIIWIVEESINLYKVSCNIIDYNSNWQYRIEIILSIESLNIIPEKLWKNYRDTICKQFILKIFEDSINAKDKDIEFFDTIGISV